MPDDEKKFTQADVDRIVSERLARDRETRGDPSVLIQTVSELRNQLAQANALNETLKSKVDTNNRTSILSKVGVELKVPPALTEFITGATEEEMRASATKLMSSIGPGPSLGGSTNPPDGNSAPKIYTAQELHSMSPDAINKDWANISAQLKAGQIK